MQLGLSAVFNLKLHILGPPPPYAWIIHTVYLFTKKLQHYEQSIFFQSISSICFSIAAIKIKNQSLLAEEPTGETDCSIFFLLQDNR